MDKKITDDPEIETLLALSDEELLTMVGRYIHDHPELDEQGSDIPGDAVRFESAVHPIVSAQEWLRRNAKKIQDLICKSKTIKEISDKANKPKSKAELIKAIGSALVDAAFTLGASIPPLIAKAIATLLVRAGLPRYCQAYWTDNKDKD